MIKVEGLTKRYARNVAVKNISFEVGKGEIVGFLGKNGAGKTTTMRVLTCFLPPTSGKASVAGFDVLEQSLEVQELSAICPKRRPLYPEMEVCELPHLRRQTEGHPVRPMSPSASTRCCDRTRPRRASGTPSSASFRKATASASASPRRSSTTRRC